MSLQLYSSSSKVIQLTDKNFDDNVIKSNLPWIIEFYAPWCGHCKNFAPEYEKTAKALEGIINVGAVDMDAYKSIGQRYQVQGFPTVKFFGFKKQDPIDYNGDRTSDELIQFAFEETKKMAKKRIGAKFSKSQSSKQNEKGEVIELTDSNFDEMVIKSQDTWFVKFYAPWCGHCKALAPTWEKLSANLNKDKIKVGKLDATTNTKIAQRYGIQGYPTLKLFPAGKKTENDFENYEGGRDLVQFNKLFFQINQQGSLESFAREFHKKKTPTMFEQLINQEIFDQFCKIERGLLLIISNLIQLGACVIAILPHIYDSSVNERNNYIQLLKDIAEKNKGSPINFLWAQGGDYYEFEENLALGSGYPALIAIAYSKNAYSIMRAAYSSKNIEQYVSGLISGKEAIQKLKKELPVFKNVKKWDGQDLKDNGKVEL